MEIQLRDMRREDSAVFYSFLAQLHQLHQENRPDLFLPAEQSLFKELFQRDLENPNTVLLLAEAEKKPAGLCVFELEGSPRDPLMLPTKRAYIHDIFVLEEYRRHGIAAALYRETERRAKEFGAKGIYLTVWAFNESAKQFYKKMGLSPTTLTLEAKL